MAQLPNSGSMEQIIRALELLALTPGAIQPDVAQVAAEMGSGAFTPTPLLAADGSTIPLSFNDVEYGDPASWLPSGFAQAFNTDQLRVIPPYPLVEFLPAPGRVVSIIDQDGTVLYGYGINVVVAADSDQPQIAARIATALLAAFDRLISRNVSLGGLVYSILPTSTVVTGQGPAEAGVLAGAMLRYEAIARQDP